MSFRRSRSCWLSTGLQISYCKLIGRRRTRIKSMIALTNHIGTYTGVLGVASVILFGISGIVFAVINGLLHFITDYFTSRWSSRLYVKQDWHNFFVVIGFDQLIHQLTIAGMVWLIFQPSH